MNYPVVENIEPYLSEVIKIIYFLCVLFYGFAKTKKK